MTDLDPNYLRPWLDEQEKFARSIAPTDPRIAIAQQMLAIIAETRNNLHPSADGTANYISNKQIIEQLSTLRVKAENAGGD